MEENTLFHVLEGNGVIQVDFKNYLDWADKLIFLETGQYIKFQSDTFVVRKIVFDDAEMFQNREVRVLFKHLVSLGYINYDECEKCQQYLSDTLFSKPKDIIDVSVNQWYWQNPFGANREEYQLIFDIKEVIDQEFKEQPNAEQVAKLLNTNSRSIRLLLKNKLGFTVKKLLSRKRLSESQKAVAFTDQPIKSIALDLGFKDVAYFNRVFKEEVGVTPGEFRESMAYEIEDVFAQQLFQLIDEFHTSERKTTFYADQLYMSEKTLAKTIRTKLNTTLGQLIRREIIRTAMHQLTERQAINEVAYALGFEEANHFSTFFKHYTQQTPTQYLSKKYKS